MQVLWQHGVRTVREVHEQLKKQRRVALTTVASMMQLMEGKGQLKVVTRVRPFRYEPVLTPDGAKDALLNDITQRLFGGSSKKLVLHLVTSKNVSKQHVQKLDKTLDALE